MEEVDSSPFVLPCRVGDYVFTREIGAGSDARAYEAISQKYNTTFCAKVSPISPEMLDETGNLSDMELYALHNLDHPNIIKLYDYFLAEGYLILILELCHGGTLAELIEKEGPLPLSLFLSFAEMIISALTQSHAAHIAHRDIKPQNIFIDQYNRPILADFGLSMFFQTPESKTRHQCGSFSYVAPEILEGKDFSPFKADIWSLGVAFYEMVTGTNPFPCGYQLNAPNAISYSRRLDPNLKALLQSMLQEDPDKRPLVGDLLKMAVFTSSLPKKKINSVRSSMDLNYNTSDLLGISKGGKKLGFASKTMVMSMGQQPNMIGSRGKRLSVGRFHSCSATFTDLPQWTDPVL